MKMNVVTKRLLFCALVTGAAAAWFAACENPWMKEATSSLYKEKDKDGGNSGGPIPLFTLNSVAAVEAWIDEQILQGHGAFTDPIPLPPLAITDAFSDYWLALITAIAGKGAYVELDLTYCGMGGVSPSGEFNPGAANTGEPFISALALPNAATSIKGGTFTASTFQHFTVMESVSGTGVTSIGYRAFDGCTSLTEVSFPAATNIGQDAFIACTGLTEVSFPAATNIGQNVFEGCTGLTTVSLPLLPNINIHAFTGCTGLTEVSFPAATYIGGNTFRNCTGLTDITLGASPPTLLSSAFASTSGGASPLITIHVSPPGTTGAYQTAWGITQLSFAVGGNTSTFGTGHNAITITDM
jgi:hypothetical protein